MSRWFVGSSSSSRSGSPSRSRASATRIDQPPLSVFTGRSKSATLKPSPMRIALARATSRPSASGKSAVARASTVSSETGAFS